VALRLARDAALRWQLERRMPTRRRLNQTGAAAPRRAGACKRPRALLCRWQGACQELAKNRLQGIPVEFTVPR